MIKHKVYQWLLFNQSHCMLCLGSQPNAAGLCESCLAELPWQGPQCRQCALPLSSIEQLCGKCQQSPPAFAQVVAPLLYRFPLDSLIPAFKHHGQLAYGRLLARLLSDAVQHHYQERQLAWPDLLLPMPLHPKRQAQRGFNQAFELARPIARSLTLKLDSNNLIRQRPTPAQQGLNATERQHNLAGAFHCRHPERLADLHLALIDDVLTTGSSAQEASRTLLAAGAASVSVWCVARTP